MKEGYFRYVFIKYRLLREAFYHYSFYEQWADVNVCKFCSLCFDEFDEPLTTEKNVSTCQNNIFLQSLLLKITGASSARITKYIPHVMTYFLNNFGAYILIRQLYVHFVRKIDFYDFGKCNKKIYSKLNLKTRNLYMIQ